MLAKKAIFGSTNDFRAVSLGHIRRQQEEGQDDAVLCVGKHSPNAYFSLVPAPLESHFRNPHPGPPLRCEAWWHKKCVLHAESRRSCRTPTFDEDTASSLSKQSVVQFVSDDF